MDFTAFHIDFTWISHAFRMQASGGQDRVVHVWGVRTNLHRHTFRGHKDGVTVSLGSEGGGRGGRGGREG